MKRIRSACIAQTLIFSQKPDAGYSKDHALRLNRNELDSYKTSLDRARTRYIILDEQVCDDGSIVIRVKKQYNHTADVSEYF